jgi:hypothetical protein
MDCPRCGLVNPSTAERCDCGYDFETKTVKTPYSVESLGGATPRLGLPYTLYLYALAMLFWFRALAFLGIALVVGFGRAQETPWRSIGFIAWVAIDLPLIFQVSRKKRWANTILAVLTMPWGVWLLTSQQVRVFLLQPTIGEDTHKS